MRNRRYTSIVVYIVVLCLCIFACTRFRKPPSIYKVERDFRNYRQEFETIVNYYLTHNTTHCDADGIISRNDGTIFVNFERVPIDDQEVVDAISLLFSHYDFFRVYRSYNTIVFVIWRHPQNISSSIAYSINKISMPVMQTPTEIIPMREAGWYYVIEDYNKWMEDNYYPYR